MILNKNRGCYFVSIQQRIKTKRSFFRRVWSGFVDFNDIEMVFDSCRLGADVDFFWIGDFVLFETCDAERRKSSFIIHQ